MSDKTPRPDRARNDDLDVPTYHRDQPLTSAYERSGRAAPQEIPAGEPTAGGLTRASRSDHQVSEGTTAFPSQRTESTSSYRDEDFATEYASEPTTVAPAATGAPATAVADQDLYADEEVAVTRERRGTIDLGLLIARLLLGVWLVIESLGTFFQLGGSEGLSGLENAYSGYPLAQALSIAVPTMQLAAGVFLIVGLLTPVAAAVATVVTGFVALHELATSGAGFNVFSWPETVWLSLVLFGLSIALQFTGPGYYSLDFGRSWARRPLASSWVFIVVAVAALVALWWFGTGINPFA